MEFDYDLFVIGGTLERSPGAKVSGEFFYFKFNLQKIENTIIPILSYLWKNSPWNPHLMRYNFPYDKHNDAACRMD